MVSRDPNLHPDPSGSMPSEIAGLRMTRQRWEVYRLLMEQKGHPTANELFKNIQDQLPNISLATVYNCLEALVQHGIIRQVNFDREPSRFCPNLEEHGHFHDKQTGSIHDITFKPGVNLADVLELPEGTVITDVELTLRGQLPASN
ncbi:Fur family transcriptional regulator [Haloferula rosea]|uniref:Transcriptional repressor n=1 Tax=Haloferula rosea TaxID=490093 RepID=A0A934VCP4_9BACT|nr:transcriptional repressor [Haloferula rosea]MBK1828663.1 transcriptional repressor [Haloferula rosea]